MVDIQSATAEIRRGKKEEEKRNHRTKYNGLPYSQGGHNKQNFRMYTVGNFVKTKDFNAVFTVRF